MKKIYLTLGTLVLFLFGCATMSNIFKDKVSGLAHDPSFTYKNIVEGKLAIGGVVSLTSE